MVLRYDGPVIARVFVDRAAGEPFTNFEIAGTEGLLVFRPSSAVLSDVRTETGRSCTYEHPVAASLTREAKP